MNTNKVANRNTIAEAFKTSSLTTHRILMNCNYGFFRSMFGENADKMWSDAHPFTYESGYRDFMSLNIDFINENFELFASHAFTTWAGWEHNSKTGKTDWVYKNWYRVEPIEYN